MNQRWSDDCKGRKTHLSQYCNERRLMEMGRSVCKEGDGRLDELDSQKTNQQHVAFQNAKTLVT